MPEAARVGPYELLHTLGSGGMGTVYLARDVRLDRHVALKFIRGDASAAETSASLLAEARAACALNHANICHVYDVGGEGRDAWIAMEYVEGATLAAALDAKGTLPPPAVVRLGRDIAAALAHAHQRGVLHRDLKPANIVCTPDGQPKILDFGIASRRIQEVAQEATRTAQPDAPAVAGTLSYMAPEAIRGEPQDARSDLWSLGILLHELATGRVPFRGRTAYELAAAILHTPLPALPADVPPPLARLITRLLAKDPAERYATAAETAAALDALDDTRQPAPPVATPRRRWLAVSATLVALAGVTAAWLLSRETSLQITEQRLISTVASPQRFPSYSPDGRWLAYASPDDQRISQIWVRDLEQGSSRQLTTGTAAATRPRWLPESSQILFAVAGQGIWTVSAVGGAPTRVIDRGTNPNVARLSDRIVFDLNRTIWTAALDGSDARPVPGAPTAPYNLPMSPALSPDGSTIAFFVPALGPNGDFWTIPAAGGTPRQLTFDLREGGWPVWTPDGRAIIVSSARAGSRTLWEVPVGGGEPQPLTTGAGEDDHPELSTDGRQLAYSNVRNTWALKVRDLTTGEERSLVERGLELLFPMFSPDGQRIVYFGRSDYAVAIFTIGADGSDLRQLTGGRELNHQPRWSHDGREVYFFQHSPTVSFRRVPALGGPSQEFRQWDWQTEAAPYFDPTGRFIAYLRQRAPDAASAPTEHTVIHEIASGLDDVWPEPHTHVHGWSPDGSSIVGLQHAPAVNAIVVCGVADRSCRHVATGIAPKWSRQGDRVFFARPAAPGTHDLWSVGLDGRNETRIAHLGSFRAIDVFFDVSPQNRVVWAPMNAGTPQLWTAQIR